MKGAVMVKSRRYTLLVLILLLVSACATIMSGTTQDVSVNCTPAGATIKVNDVVRGQCPTILKLKKGEKTTVTIELEGYRPYTMTLERRINGWVFGNILLGGIIGLVIDAADGAMYKFETDAVVAGLARLDADTIVVNVTNGPTNDMKKIAQFEKTIPEKPTGKDVAMSRDPNQIPQDWPQMYFYETEEFSYWTVSGPLKGDQSEAVMASKDKADEIMTTEFPNDKFSQSPPYETTHMEVVNVNNGFKCWRLIRVSHTEVAKCRK